jgi:glycerophosphoryl diester phosphodiesterase
MAPAFAGQRIPELGELLALARGRLVLFVELKEGDGLEERVAALLAPRRTRGGVVLLSFDAARLARAKALLPEVPTLLLARRRAGDTPRLLVDRALAARAAVVGVELHGLDRPVVEAAHGASLGVFAWTVNDAEAARRLAALGVDGVITDHPDRIRAALGAQP